MLDDLLFRLRALRRHAGVERELDEELRFHIERHAAALLKAGLSPEEAARRARVEFGGVEQVKEDCRDARGIRPLEDLGQDIRFAARLLAKDRWFTLSAVIALALCIAASTTTFTLVNALTRGLPVDAPDRIVKVVPRDSAGRPLRFSPRDFEEWRRATALTGIAGFAQSVMTVSDGRASPERLGGAYLSADAFRLLGERPILGRDFVADDGRPGAAAVAILGGKVWRNRYGGDPSVVGRTLVINDVPSVVIGVMPEGFRFPMVSDLWLPLPAMPGFRERREARIFDAFGRLTADATMSQAESELQTIAARLAREYPETDRGVAARVRPYVDGRLGHPFFLALLGGVGLLLSIGCANVANLLLARETRRSHETGIRLSLGGTRWRIVRQMLVESGLVGGAAGAMGFALALLAVRLIANDLEGINFPYWQRWTMDGRVYVFACLVSVGSVFIFGLAPALHISRSKMNEVLREGGRSMSGGVRARRWTSVLLGIELAITLVLLAGAGLMMRSFLALYRADLVIDVSNLLAAPLELPPPSYAAAGRRAAFWQRLEDRLQGIPGLSGVSTASSVPFGIAPRVELTLEGRSGDSVDSRPTVSFVSVGPGYFETLGLRLDRGRTFSERDRLPGHESAIVNRRLAAMFFPGEDPIGKRLRLAGTNAGDETPTAWLTIVGISPSVRHQQTFDLRELDPVIYVPRRTDSQAMWLVLRGKSGQEPVGSIVREEIRALDRDLALSDMVPLEAFMTQSRWPNRIFTGIFAGFAWISTILAAVGLYGVTAYAVTQRTREIGLRVALGARVSQVVWLFVRRAVAPLAAGLAIGLAGAVAVGRLLRSFLVQTASTDPVTLIAVAVLLVSVAVAACLLPARRATRLDPVAALRYE
jgi:predicted permease